MIRSGNVQRQVRKAKRIGRIFLLVFIAICAVFIRVGGNYYKESRVFERNMSTGDLGKSIDACVRQLENEKRQELFDDHNKKFNGGSKNKGEAFLKGELTMEDIQKESEESMKEFNDISSFSLKGDFYVFGTVDKNGCYAEPCELFEERERIISIDPSEVPYNWAVHVKDGKAVEAWMSKDTLGKDMRPYTKEEQIKQYGPLIGGKSENITGYWHTPF